MLAVLAGWDTNPLLMLPTCSSHLDSPPPPDTTRLSRGAGRCASHCPATCFIDEETEAWKGEEVCLESHSHRTGTQTPNQQPVLSLLWEACPPDCLIWKKGVNRDAVVAPLTSQGEGSKVFYPKKRVSEEKEFQSCLWCMHGKRWGWGNDLSEAGGQNIFIHSDQRV